MHICAYIKAKVRDYLHTLNLIIIFGKRGRNWNKGKSKEAIANRKEYKNTAPLGNSTLNTRKAKIAKHSLFSICLTTANTFHFVAKSVPKQRGMAERPDTFCVSRENVYVRRSSAHRVLRIHGICLAENYVICMQAVIFGNELLCRTCIRARSNWMHK